MKKKRLEKVTIEEVLIHMREKRTLLNNIIRIKVNWIGHILRRNFIFYDAIEG